MPAKRKTHRRGRRSRRRHRRTINYSNRRTPPTPRPCHIRKRGCRPRRTRRQRGGQFPGGEGGGAAGAAGAANSDNAPQDLPPAAPPLMRGSAMYNGVATIIVRYTLPEGVGAAGVAIQPAHLQNSVGDPVADSEHDNTYTQTFAGPVNGIHGMMSNIDAWRAEHNPTEIHVRVESANISPYQQFIANIYVEDILEDFPDIPYTNNVGNDDEGGM